MIRELISLVQGVLKFDSAAFTRHIESKDALKRGLLLIILAALLAGFFPFLGEVVNSFSQPNFADIEAQMRQQIDLQKQFNPSLRDPQFARMYDETIQAVIAMIKDITGIKPNVAFLPNWLGRLLAALGAWLSTPVAWIAGWLGYALWVMLFAKLLGGRATLSKMLGATTLFVAPHVFNVFTGLLSLMGKIPVAGTCFGGLGILLGLGLWVWGTVVYVKATATANEFGLGQATLATVLPAVLAGLFALLLAIAWVVLIVIGSR
jgi:hypothetical protein